MRAIVGIGNPGNRYKNNRHNVGFQFLDYFSERKSLVFKASKFDYHYSEGELSNVSFVLIKPDTYVNLSGVAVLNCITNFKIDIKDVLVVVDDINLDVASIRIRKSGGDGGHKGLSSIIYSLNSNEFPRLRIGIGNDFKIGQLSDYVLSDYVLSDYVLSDFDKDDLIKIRNSFDLGSQLVENFVLDGYQKMLTALSRIARLDDQKGKLD